MCKISFFSQDHVPVGVELPKYLIFNIASTVYIYTTASTVQVEIKEEQEKIKTEHKKEPAKKIEN